MGCNRLHSKCAMSLSPESAAAPRPSSRARRGPRWRSPWSPPQDTGRKPSGGRLQPAAEAPPRSPRVPDDRGGGRGRCSARRGRRDGRDTRSPPSDRRRRNRGHAGYDRAAVVGTRLRPPPASPLGSQLTGPRSSRCWHDPGFVPTRGRRRDGRAPRRGPP